MMEGEAREMPVLHVPYERLTDCVAARKLTRYDESASPPKSTLTAPGAGRRENCSGAVPSTSGAETPAATNVPLMSITRIDPC